MSPPIGSTPTASAAHRQGRRHRLTAKSDFDKVFRQGRRSADGLFTILFLPNGLDVPRLGFAISRQNVRRAVGRNRLRRLVRESFRSHRAGLVAVDIVVMARPAARTATNPAVFASLEQHWRRLARGPAPVSPAPTARDH